LDANASRNHFNYNSRGDNNLRSASPPRTNRSDVAPESNLHTNQHIYTRGYGAHAHVICNRTSRRRCSPHTEAAEHPLCKAAAAGALPSSDFRHRRRRRPPPPQPRPRSAEHFIPLALRQLATLLSALLPDSRTTAQTT